LASAVRAARAAGIPHFLLGRGANILVGDRGFRGLVIRSEARGVEFIDEVRVRAGAGLDVFPDLIDATVARGLGGLHHFVGIPSTVGGALWQNLHFLSPAPARFGYDQSVLHDRDDIVLSATFRLEPTPIPELRRVTRENLEWRDERHPDLWLYPCAGSIFRKIDGVGAGRLIDQCGLKGRVHGGAGIFHKHANIIVNLGGATAADVRFLIDLARDTVARETGHQLVPEIAFVGEF
jgi:UDP-N-acetylmuramate dehydrogenase